MGHAPNWIEALQPVLELVGHFNLWVEPIIKVTDEVLPGFNPVNDYILAAMIDQLLNALFLDCDAVPFAKDMLFLNGLVKDIPFHGSEDNLNHDASARDPLLDDYLRGFLGHVSLASYPYSMCDACPIWQHWF